MGSDKGEWMEHRPLKNHAAQSKFIVASTIETTRKAQATTMTRLLSRLADFFAVCRSILKRVLQRFFCGANLLF